MKSWAVLSMMLVMSHAYTQEVSHAQALFPLLSQAESSVNDLKIKIPVSTIGPCSKPVETAIEIKSIVASGSSIIKFATCNSELFDKAKNLDNSTCQAAIACRNSFFDSSEGFKEADDILRNQVAKEYYKAIAEKSSDKLERFEILKNFALDKYKKSVASGCSGKIDSKAKVEGSCNLGLLDRVFDEHQTKCNFRNGCYNSTNDGVLGYLDYKKENKKKISPSMAISYFKYRTEERSKKMLSGDEEFLNDFADFATSDELKDAKSKDEKVKIIAKYLSANATKIDPLLSFEFFSESGEEALKSNVASSKLMKLLSDSKNTKKSFLKEYDKYREDRAKEIFNKDGKECKSIDTVRALCADMTAISEGRTLNMPSLSADKISIGDLKNSDLYKSVNEKTDNKVNEKNFAAVLNAAKCVAYNLPKKRDPITGTMVASNASNIFINPERESSLIPNIFSFSSQPRSYLGNDDYSSSSSSNKFSSTSSGSTSGSSAVSSGSAQSLESVAPNTPVSVAPVRDVAPSNISGNFANSYNPSAMDPIIPTITPETSLKDSGATKGNAFSANRPASIDSELDSLKKSLAESKAKISEMQASAKELKEAEEKKAEQERIAKEEEVIAGLKNQIADLQKKKEASASSKVASSSSSSRKEAQSEEQDNSSDSPSVKVDHTPRREVVYEEPVVIKRRDYSASDDAISSRSPASVEGSNGALLTATKGSAGPSDKTAAVALGAAPISVDGLSTEAFNEIVKTNVQDLKGQSFLIEEGGYIKEVFPKLAENGELVYENGKPVYTKIIKGKKNDPKFAKANVTNRKPASAADVKIQNDNLRERVQYKDLKAVIKSAGQ